MPKKIANKRRIGFVVNEPNGVRKQVVVNQHSKDFLKNNFELYNSISKHFQNYKKLFITLSKININNSNDKIRNQFLLKKTFEKLDKSLNQDLHKLAKKLKIKNIQQFINDK